MKRVNDWLASRMSAFMSTMLLFWILCILDIGGLFLQTPKGAQGWLLWGVSIFFQSVALPVLGFVADKQGKQTAGLLQDTHDRVMGELAEIRAMHREKQESDARRDELLRRIVEGVERDG